MSIHLKVTRIFLILLSALVLFGCVGEKSFDSRLEDTWISNKEMSLKSIDPLSATPSQQQFLEKNLGQLSFIFKGNKTAVAFSGFKNEEPNFESYNVTNKTSDSVSIKTSHSVEATYYFSGDCIYIVNTQWGYKEYFCKGSTGV